MIQEEIVAQFRDSIPRLERISNLLEQDLTARLVESGIKIQHIESRRKSEKSFREKISRPDKTYLSLWDVTDLVGIRVITYFEETTNQVADLIEKHFVVDLSRSTNKVQTGGSRMFGYRSLHYICSLDPRLRNLVEFPDDFRFEIQIRTVLQHAWAEIEHDLGYKAHDSIPESVHRRFSRVASLLEIADEEFGALRREIADYTQLIRLGGADLDSVIPLNRISLDHVLKRDEIRALDEVVATCLGKAISSDIFFPEYLVKMLRACSITTLPDLLQAIHRHGEHISDLILPYFAFTKNAWGFSADRISSVQRGYSLLFLSHAVIVKSPALEIHKVSHLTRLYHQLDYPDDEKRAARVAAELYAALSAR